MLGIYNKLNKLRELFKRSNISEELDNDKVLENTVLEKIKGLKEGITKENVLTRFQAFSKDTDVLTYFDEYSDKLHPHIPGLLRSAIKSGCGRIPEEETLSFARTLTSNDVIRKSTHGSDPFEKGHLLFDINILARKMPKDQKLDAFHALEENNFIHTLMEKGCEDVISSYLSNIFRGIDLDVIDKTLSNSTILDSVEWNSHLENCLRDKNRERGYQLIPIIKKFCKPEPAIEEQHNMHGSPDHC